jgi:uncharacterized protein YbjQ (UPF0145 family)
MSELVIGILVLVVGLIFGTLNEKAHFRSLKKREEDTLHLPTVTFGRPPAMESMVIERVELVAANVVISIDAFKKLVSGIVNVFGGNVVSYETLIDRARREALLRVKEAHPNAKAICNARIETTAISKNAKQNVGAVEVLIYGTAVY